MDPYEPPEDQLLTRREALRAQRTQTHAAPARIRIGLGAALVLACGAISWFLVSWVISGGAGEELPEAPSPAASGESRDVEQPPDAAGREAEDQDTEEEGSSVVVHVAGAVTEPQVVDLQPGARVHEAVDAAGGLTDQAAAEGVNLAAEVTDGELIWVPTVEELENDDDASPPGGSADSGEEHDSDGPINLNTSSAEELEDLPGIGPALAERIIAHRESHGDFGSLEELAAVNGIGPAIIENIGDEVTW